MRVLRSHWLKRKLYWLARLPAVKTKLEQCRIALWIVVISDLILYGIKSAVIIYLTYALIYLGFQDIAKTLVLPWLLVCFLKLLSVYFLLYTTFKDNAGANPLGSLQTLRLSIVAAIICLFGEALICRLNFEKLVWVSGTAYAFFVSGVFMGVAYLYSEQVTKQQLPHHSGMTRTAA